MNIQIKKEQKYYYMNYPMNLILLIKQSIISKLEKQEMELIERLQTTQNIQKQAFDDLEKALATTLKLEDKE